MEICKGDRVKFLNEVGAGIVTRVEKKLIYVFTDDGFEIPILKNEVVIIEHNDVIVPEVKQPESEYISSYYEDDNDENFEEGELELEHEIIEKEDDNSINVCLAFIPQNLDSENGEMLIYLVNDSNYNLLYNVAAQHKNEWTTIKADTIEANTKFLIGSFLKSDLNSISSLIFQVILFKNNIYTPFDPIDETIKLTGSKFFKKNSFVKNEYFEEDAYIITFLGDAHNFYSEPELSKSEIEKLLREKNDLVQVDNIKQQKQQANIFEIEEVDLHIEKLLDDYRGMSNTEILLFQMSHFKTKLDNATLRNVRKIVFIHGVGNGTLKHAIRKSLTETFSDFKFQDASFKEYGYGATLVYLK